MHLLVTAIEKPDHQVDYLHTVGAFVRSAFEDIQQQRRGAIAGAWRNKLEPRPDDDSARLFSREEGKMLATIWGIWAEHEIDFSRDDLSYNGDPPPPLRANSWESNWSRNVGVGLGGGFGWWRGVRAAPYAGVGVSLVGVYVGVWPKFLHHAH